MIKKLFIPILLLALTLMLSACGQFHPDANVDPENEDFYQGSQGIMMRFSPGSPPSRFHYYSGTLTNEFDISVELHNEGASDSYGALYISGFSPHMFDIMVDGQLIGEADYRKQGCTFSLVGTFGLQCTGPNGQNMGLEFDGQKINLNLNNMFPNIPGLTDMINVNCDFNDGCKIGGKFFGNTVTGFERLFHGPAMILAVNGIFSDANDFLVAYEGVPMSDDGMLFGDNYYFPGGEHLFKTFTASVENWPEGLDETDVNFAITSCYGYTTYAAPMICIDPDPYSDVEKTCTPKEYSWSGSQGAPVAITNLKQDPTPVGTFLTFTVRNVGNGRVMNPFLLPECSPYNPERILPSDYDVIYIGDVRIGSSSIHPINLNDPASEVIKCTPSKMVRLIDGVGTFTCEYRYEFMGSNTAYEIPVVVELWYGYKDYMVQSVHIKRAG